MTKLVGPTFAEMFSMLWKQLVPARPFHREHRFHTERKWRFDFAWPDSRVAVEMEGGVFTGGRHTRGMAFVRDCEKYNAAALLGWRVLRYTRHDLDRRPIQVIEEVKQLLGA